MLERPTFAVSMRRTFELMGGDARRAVTVVIVLAGIGALMDWMSPSGSGVNVVQGAAGIVAQYSVTAGVLGDLNLMPDGYRNRPFWAMLGLSILFNLGVALGLLLLVVPGVVLAIRWSLAVPALIAEETGVTGALGASWRATKGCFWPILAVLSAIYLPMIAVVFGAMLVFAMQAGGVEASTGVGTSALFNLIVEGAIVTGWYACIALYERAGSGAGHLHALSDTFA